MGEWLDMSNCPMSNVRWTCPAVHHVVHLLLLRLFDLLVRWACHWQRGQGAMCLCQLRWVIGCPIVRTWNHPHFHSVSSLSNPASSELTRKRFWVKIFDFMGSAMSNPHKHFPQESERKNLSFQNVSEGQEWSPSTILPHFYFLCFWLGEDVGDV